MWTTTQITTLLQCRKVRRQWKLFCKFLPINPICLSLSLSLSLFFFLFFLCFFTSPSLVFSCFPSASSTAFLSVTAVFYSIFSSFQLSEVTKTITRVNLKKQTRQQKAIYSSPTNVFKVVSTINIQAFGILTWNCFRYTLPALWTKNFESFPLETSSLSKNKFAISNSFSVMVTQCRLHFETDPF